MTKPAQNLLLALVGAAVLWITLASDEYLNYVRPGFRYVLVPAALVLIVLGAVGLVRERRAGAGPPTPAGEAPTDGPHADDDSPAGGHAHAGGHGPRVAWLLCLPITAIFFIAPPALGSYTASRDTGRAPPPPPPPAEGYSPLPATAGPTEMTMAEFISRSFAAQTGSTNTFQGRPVSLTGFVAPRAEGGGWYLTRLRINCCAGDALPLQVIVRDQERPPTDSWVRVTGTWTSPADPDHVTYELRGEQVRPINKPKNAYEG